MVSETTSDLADRACAVFALQQSVTSLTRKKRLREMLNEDIFIAKHYLITQTVLAVPLKSLPIIFHHKQDMDSVLGPSMATLTTFQEISITPI